MLRFELDLGPQIWGRCRGSCILLAGFLLLARGLEKRCRGSRILLAGIFASFGILTLAAVLKQKSKDKKMHASLHLTCRHLCIFPETSSIRTAVLQFAGHNGLWRPAHIAGIARNLLSVPAPYRWASVTQLPVPLGMRCTNGGYIAVHAWMKAS